MRRTVLMYVEISCFLSCLGGWILICSTLATEYWTFSEVSSVVLATGNYYSNLWMDCMSDTTGVSDCKYYPSLMGLPAFLHATRALAIVSVIFGFWGTVLALIGMKCTKIGGSELTNTRITLAAGLTYLACGFCGIIVYSWWGNKVRLDFVDPYYLEQKFELGAAVFIGWGGSCLVLCGSAVMCYFTARKSFPESFEIRAAPSYMTARTRQSYALSGWSRPRTVIISPSQHSYSQSRVTRVSRASPGRSRTQKSRSSRSVRTTRLVLDSAV